MKKTGFIIVAIAVALASSIRGQDSNLGRERLFERDFDEALTALEGASATAEVRLLRAMATVGNWVETDWSAFLQSTGAEASEADRLMQAAVGWRVGEKSDLLEENWIQGQATPLASTIENGLRHYSFPADQSNVLLLHNKNEQPVSFEVFVEFASDADGMSLYLDGNWWGSVDSYAKYLGWDYQAWNDGTLDKSFFVSLNPNQRLLIKHRISGVDAGVGQATRFGVAEALFISGTIEAQTGQYDWYNAPRHPLNVLYASDPVIDPVVDEELKWREGGQVVPPDTEFPPVQVDYSLTQGDVFYNGADDARSLSFVFEGQAPQQVDLAVAVKDVWPAFEGSIFINGIKVGDFSSWEISWFHPGAEIDVEDGVDLNSRYHLGVFLHPGDRLTLSVSKPDSSWYWPGGEESNQTFLGIGLEASAGNLVVQNGLASVEPFPRFATGFGVDDVADSLFGDSGEWGSLLSNVIAQLEPIETGFAPVAFSPAETGLLEELRLTHTDVELLLAGMKFFRGIQILASMQDPGEIPLTLSTFEPYFDDPFAFWDNHPELLTLLQSRSGQGGEAKRFFTDAIAHYRAVESDLWTRQPGIGWRYLFQLSDLLERPTQAEVAADLATFEAGLSDFVPLNEIDPLSDASSSVSLAPLFSNNPPGLRPLLPPFDERGFLSGYAESLVQAGFTRGISSLQADKMLASGGFLYIPPPETLTGKVLYLNSMVSPYWGSLTRAYRFTSAATVSAAGATPPLDRAFIWDPAEGLFYDLASGESFRLVFETAASGYFEKQSDDPYAWPERGGFILYDEARDLDQDNRSDGGQVGEGELPFYPTAPGDSVFEDFADDWDGDGVPDDSTPQPEPWYGSASNIADGWRYFGWFKGFKPEGENWIFHGRHGWLYVKAEDTSGMFLWDGALGRWMFTNETVYPWMYAYGPGEGWVFFFEGGRPGSRYFKRGETGEVILERELSVNP